MTTDPITLRQWKDEDLEPYAAMNADAEVMRYFPKPLTLAESKESLLRLRAEIDQQGWGLWAVEVGGALLVQRIVLSGSTFSTESRTSRLHRTPRWRFCWCPEFVVRGLSDLTGAFALSSFLKRGEERRPVEAGSIRAANGSLFSQFPRHFRPRALAPCCPRSIREYFNVIKPVTIMRPSPKKTFVPIGACLLALATFGPSLGTAFAQQPSTNQPWAYLLLSDSFLVDDCLLCGRPSIQAPLRGSFNLRLIDQNPLAVQYAVEDIQFKAGDRPYRVAGGGTLEIGGEVAVTLSMKLQVDINDGFTNKVCYFTNTTTTINRPWPMMDITVSQTNGTFAQVYTLRLAAAPVRDIWFSTASGFTATAGQSSSNYVQGGNLLSTSGRIVKRNADLFTSVGAFPPAPDLGLDALDMQPGGEILFSLGSGIFSTTLGLLQQGDLLSNKGRIFRRNQELLAPFLTQPATNDVGLDAVCVLETGEILFSIKSNVFSAKLNTTLHHGNLLSSTGAIMRSNQQLLAGFHPTDTNTDYGLDALYVWPGGELWFSTETGFQDQVLGAVLAGDLLSDQGYIVFRNLELLGAFAPKETLPDFGLDALYIVTDATPLAPGSLLAAIKTDTSSRSSSLTWQGQGRVFQVERADAPTGPFQSLSPILPDEFFDDLAALTNRPQSFYRLRQW